MTTGEMAAGTGVARQIIIPTRVFDPGYVWLPEGARLGDDSAADLMAECGMPMDPWQRLALRVMLATLPNGLWAGREAGLVVPRQNGKSVLLAAIALHGLLITREPLQLWSAHQFRTAQESFRLIGNLFDASAALRRRLKTIRASHGQEMVEMRDGCRLQFIARIRTSGRGFSGERLILDEAMELGSESVDSLIPTMAAKRNPQALYAASAGMVSTDHLRKVRDRARRAISRARYRQQQSERALVWLEYCARQLARPTAKQMKELFKVEQLNHETGELEEVYYDLDSEKEITRANPTLGARMSMEHVRMERSTMDDEAFARERLGIWTDPPGEELIDRPFSPKEWDARTTSDRPGINALRVLAVDVGPDGSSASIGGAMPMPDGRIFVSLIERRPGTRWLVRKLQDISDRRTIECVGVDGIGQSGALVADLQEHVMAPIRVQTTKDVINGAAEIQAGVKSATVCHSGDEQLAQAVIDARKRMIGDTGWGWRRSDSEADITPLVAVTIAHHLALQYVRKGEVDNDDETEAEFG